MHQQQNSPKILLAFCLLLFVTACSAPNTHITLSNVPTPSITSTFTSTITIIPTTLPTKQSTSTPIPPQLSLVGSPTTTFTTANYELTKVQTPDEKATQIASFQITCTSVNDIKHHSHLAPDGNWLAISCEEGRNITLEIVNQEGIRWLLRYKDYVAEEFKDTHGQLYPSHWQNGDYLYFTADPHISVGGLCMYGRGYSLGLYRINLHTGMVSATLPPLTLPNYSFAFSPNERRLAYIGARNQIFILDLKTGEEEPVEMKDDSVGNLTWSPDSSKLAYASCQINQDNSELFISYIKVFSIDTHASITIVKEENKLIGIDVRDANPLMKIIGNQNMDDSANLYLYDWSSGQIVTLVQSPTPTP